MREKTENSKEQKSESNALIGIKLVSFDDDNNFESEVVKPLETIAPGVEAMSVFSKRGWMFS